MLWLSETASENSPRLALKGQWAGLPTAQCGLLHLRGLAPSCPLDSSRVLLSPESPPSNHGDFTHLFPLLRIFLTLQLLCLPESYLNSKLKCHFFREVLYP